MISGRTFPATCYMSTRPNLLGFPQQNTLSTSQALCSDFGLSIRCGWYKVLRFRSVSWSLKSSLQKKFDNLPTTTKVVSTPLGKVTTVGTGSGSTGRVTLRVLISLTSNTMLYIVGDILAHTLPKPFRS